MEKVETEKPVKEKHSSLVSINVSGAVALGGILSITTVSDLFIKSQTEHIQPLLNIASAAFAVTKNHDKYNYINLKNFWLRE